ncbi:MAG: hypothetical protein IT223_09050 [Crocinitomicaceae bacterium]|nr:hypothetical protein [Crocinitomicaceae bacterium]
MKNLSGNTENQLPDDAGKRLTIISRDNEFSIPEGYFDSLENRILEKAMEPVAEDFFEKQEEEIIAQVKLENKIGKHNHFEIPEGYFEKMAQDIVSSNKEQTKVIVHPSSGGRRLLNRVMGIAAAAAIFFVIYLYSGTADKNESFEALLNESGITEEDISYFSTEEEYYDYYLEEIEEMLSDSLVTGAGAPSGRIQHYPKQNEINSDRAIIPNTPADTLSWENLSDEDIMEYLLESEDETNNL